MFKLQILDNPARSIWLVGEKIALGSHKDNEMILGSLGSEEFHAEIVITANGLRLVSKQGSCYVNGLLAEAEHVLKADDVLRIGKDTMQIVDSVMLTTETPAEIPAVKSTNDEEKPKSWFLVPKSEESKIGEFLVVGASILGRSDQCKISIPNKLLSREHAELKIENGKFIVTDLDSANSIYHNGVKISRAEVNKGDTLTFANVEFMVEQRATDELKKERKKAAETESVNQTMIRPAMDIDAEIRRIKAESDRKDNNATLIAVSADKVGLLSTAGASPEIKGVPGVGTEGGESGQMVSEKKGSGKTLLIVSLCAILALVIAAFLSDTRLF